jgi:hypothetical protein
MKPRKSKTEKIMKHNFGRKSAPDTRLTCIIGGDIFISPISKRKTTNFWPNAGFAREFQSVVPYTSTQLVSPCARPIFVTAIPFCFNFCFSPWCQINTFCTISLPGTEQCLFFFFMFHWNIWIMMFDLGLQFLTATWSSPWAVSS